MDTRRKILTRSQALETANALRTVGTPIVLMSGYFDVLQPSMTRQIPSPRPGRLFALVLDPPAPLLVAQARAELAAALQVIDYVIYSPSEPADFIASLAPDQHIRAQEDHLTIREQLIRHVSQRVLERPTGSPAGGQSH